ncbi:MAG: hypothetical protein HYS57_03360 [Parcubacteria group bacterium]|nr:hypothetical protein [Parcubacteria group bacterium]
MERFHKTEEKLIQRLAELKETGADLHFIEQFRRVLLAKIEGEATLSTTHRHIAFLPQLRFASVAVTALIIALTSGGAVTFAQKSLPNDFLYPVKLAAERAKIVLAQDEFKRAGLRVMFAEKRLSEIQAAKDRGATLDPRAIFQNLSRFEKELSEAHDQINVAKSGGQSERLLDAALSVEERIFNIEQKLVTLKESFGDTILSFNDPKINEAVMNASEATQIGLDHVADTIFSLVDNNTLTAEKRQVTLQKVATSTPRRIERTLEKLGNRIAIIEEKFVDSQEAALSPFIAPDTDTLQAKSDDRIAQSLIASRKYLAELKASLQSPQRDIGSLVHRVQELRSTVEELEAEFEE